MDSRREAMLWEAGAEQFLAFDLQLFLDTHPDAREALRMFDKHSKNYQRLKKEYEAEYGPLSADTAEAGNRWRWIDDPWPWE